MLQTSPDSRSPATVARLYRARITTPTLAAPNDNAARRGVLPAGACVEGVERGAWVKLLFGLGYAYRAALEEVR